MSTQNIVVSLERDLLGGTAQVKPIVDRTDHSVSRYLIRSAPATEILGIEDPVTVEMTFVTQHVQMSTELVFYEYTGPFAFEVPFNILIEHIEIYRAMAFKLLTHSIALKVHVIFVSDMPEYEHDFLMAELAELVALGVEIVLDNITTQDDILLASKVLSVVDEVRMDISAKGMTSYAHLSALMSAGANQKTRIGVVLDSYQDLPEFCSTYQRL